MINHIPREKNNMFKQQYYDSIPTNFNYRITN